MEKKTDYEVGYGKPPKHTQFKKGGPGRKPRTGQPTDRSFAALIDRELATLMWVTVGGNRKRVTKRSVIVWQQVKAAAAGEVAASKMLMRLNAHVTKRGEKTLVVCTVDGQPVDEWQRSRERDAAARRELEEPNAYEPGNSEEPN
jgi:hypothetical protein